MADAQKKEKKGLSKAWKKFKDSFKSQGPSTTSSSVPKPTTTAPSTSTTTAKTEPAKAPAPAPVTSKRDQPPQMSDADRRLVKAREIFKKYDFEFDEDEWKKAEPIKQTQDRVHKPIRMRVKYTCHECQTQFGRIKKCVKCSHQRCDKCTRYPPKKDKPKAMDIIEVDPEHNKPVATS